MSGAARGSSAAFLFLGELFLIPHLLPIAIALARRSDEVRIDLFVISNIHENVIREVIKPLHLPNIAIIRARGFRCFAPERLEIGRLPSKLLVLALNGFAILAHDVVVVAERTSLWLPRMTRRRGGAFIYNEHGAGPHANFRSRRNRFAKHILMPASGMIERLGQCGHQDAPAIEIGYVKRDFIRQLASTRSPPTFPDARTTVIYAPHWKQDKSSWWTIGEEVLAYFSRSDRYNLILAPHLRLPSIDRRFRDKVKPFLSCPNIIIDEKSFRLVDQTYIDHADIYLGDGSSQVVEFAETPRPIIFLNGGRHSWQDDPRYSHWVMGDVIDTVAELPEALERASQRLRQYAPVQAAYVARMMGIDDGLASARGAAVILQTIVERRGGYL